MRLTEARWLGLVGQCDEYLDDIKPVCLVPLAEDFLN